MTTLDHVGFAVAEYARSKRFYEKALAPLGMTRLIEFSGAAAGFGRAEGGRPSFFIEAYGEPVRGRLHIALAAESHAQVDGFHAAAIEAGGTDNGAPGLRWYHTDYYGAYVLDPDGTTSKPSATDRSSRRLRGLLGSLSVRSHLNWNRETVAAPGGSRFLVA
jgi:catechol 2,3-dioxygenase-like lactoylglutathione lyase family enzyme